MPFKGVDVMDVKKQFVLKALNGRVVFTGLCREYGISTKCGYKWKQRFLEEGYAGLEEHSRKPLSNSYRVPYKNILVPREDLEKIIKAGLSAPSGCNKQTTSLVGLDDSRILDLITALLLKMFKKVHFNQFIYGKLQTL